ncbi:MAG: hypothetical protein AAAFM81_13240, partial [Pseudomonadota bacterium]
MSKQDEVFQPSGTLSRHYLVTTPLLFSLVVPTLVLDRLLPRVSLGVLLSNTNNMREIKFRAWDGKHMFEEAGLTPNGNVLVIDLPDGIVQAGTDQMT